MHVERDRSPHLCDHLDLIIRGRDHVELNQLDRAVARFVVDDLAVVEVARIDSAEVP